MEITEASWRKATKEFECDLCGVGIGTGEKYFRESATDGVTFYSFYTCKPCMYDGVLDLVYEHTGEDVEKDDVIEWAKSQVEDSESEHRRIAEDILDRTYPPVVGYVKESEPYQLP